jgi:rhodanese-related sulfurtransferase
MVVRTIECRELHSKHLSGEPVELIDVRTPKEYQAVHAHIARNVPLDSLKPRELVRERDGDRREPIYVICHTGTRAEMACAKFVEQGYENVVSVMGGTAAWAAGGLPVNRGKKFISVDRQMRIFAGSLVLVGALLGYLWNIGFLGLSAFIGAGLIFAGVTNYCPMLNLISRMPWNQDQQKCCN